MTRTRTRRPAAARPTPEPQVEAAPPPPEAAPEATAEAEATAPEAAPDVPEIKPELPFGADPDDLVGADAAAQPEEPVRVTPSKIRTVVYRGLRVTTGRPDPGPVAITVNVPDDRDKDYERVVTSGRTYTLHRDRATQVEPADAGWLTRHTAYRIEVIKQP